MHLWENVFFIFANNTLSLVYDVYLAANLTDSSEQNSGLIRPTFLGEVIMLLLMWLP